MVSPTSGYQAGIESNQVSLAYAVESTWGTLAANTPMKSIRYTSETLKLARTRQRPLEIRTTREAAAAVTTQQQATGAINYAFSYGTYDDLFAIALGNEWSTPLSIVGVSGDIALTAGTPNTLISTTSGKFTTVQAGTWIRLSGFALGTPAGANNGVYYVQSKPDNLTLHLVTTRTIASETPTGTLAVVLGSSINNGTEFRSMWLQKLFSSSLALEYPGSFVQQFTLTGRLGQFFSGAFNIFAKDEEKLTSDKSGSGGITAAGTGGRVINPVSGFMQCFVDFGSIGVAIDQFDMTVVNTGAAGEYGLGNASAQGMLQGYLEASGSFRAYFPSFSLYDEFTAELDHNVAFQFQDNNTDGYVISLYDAAFSDAAINAGGIGQPVYATYQFQANPRATGGTIQFDALPHA